jgi:hypothetical protein
MRTLLALLVGCLISTSALGQDVSRAEAQSAKADETWREARIRPQDPRLAELIREGVARSATFRDIVKRIESGNLFVYVSLSPNMKASLAGKLTWMTKSGAFRYVRATINAEQTSNQMIATLAHELQHALEVGAHESVVDQRSLAGLYKRIGRASSLGVIAGYETEAAHAAGLQVRRELIASAAAAAAALRAIDSSQS